MFNCIHDGTDISLIALSLSLISPFNVRPLSLSLK